MIRYSLIIPAFNNEGSLPELSEVCQRLARELGDELEVVWVVDGSPDNTLAWLSARISDFPYPTQLLGHSRNFGSFAAIRTGLKAARGEYCAVMAADLQEPPELVLSFFASLRAGECDVAVGSRSSRADAFFDRAASRLFWWLFRSLVNAEVPPGGVDVFGCTAAVRDVLIVVSEANSSLIGLLFWVGFRRKTFTYARQPRRHGRSAWTFRKKWRYLSDSLYSFSDLPIRFIIRLGIVGILVAAVLGGVSLVAKLVGFYEFPGYATIVTAICFFGSLNLLALGIIGDYVWRAYENTKNRPESIVALRLEYGGQPLSDSCGATKEGVRRD